MGRRFSIRSSGSESGGGNNSDMEIEKKTIIFLICDLLFIFMLAYTVWDCLCNNQHIGDAAIDYDAVGNTEQAAKAADGAANRLDSAKTEIEHAKRIGDGIAETIANSRGSVTGSAEEIGRITSGIDDCQSILDRCESRNREITEIISGLASTGKSTPDGEQPAKTAK